MQAVEAFHPTSERCAVEGEASVGWEGAQVASRSPPELAGCGNPGSLTGRPVATLVPNIPSAEEPEEWVASPHLVAQGRGDLLGLEVAEN